MNDEIHSIITCNQCYQNAYLKPNTSFVLPCDKPHLIVWAKPKGYNFWLAKLMHIVSLDKQIVYVRFFGDHSVFDIPAGNCFLYSPTHPDVPKKCHLEIYTKALNVNSIFFNIWNELIIIIIYFRKPPSILTIFVKFLVHLISLHLNLNRSNQKNCKNIFQK